MPGTVDKKTGICDFTFSEVAEAWKAWRKGELETKFNQHHFDGSQHQWKNARWQGFTLEEADDWLENGYQVEAFEDVHSFAPHIERRRVRAHETEGDLMYDSWLSGAEKPFIVKNKVKTRPGLEIEAELTMHAGTPASVIVDYLVWLNRVAYTCEARGSDVAIRIASPGTNLLTNQRSKRTITRITVKRPGEWLDQNAWAPMLSPAGYRGFVFMAMIMHAELEGCEADYGLGHCASTGRWDCHLEDGILRVVCPKSDSEFPEAMMTEKMAKLIQEYR